jgi:hypothetical protein
MHLFVFTYELTKCTVQEAKKKVPFISEKCLQLIQLLLFKIAIL